MLVNPQPPSVRVQNTVDPAPDWWAHPGVAGKLDVLRQTFAAIGRLSP